MKPSNAMVLAAGLGLRMRPLTDAIPKPLVEVAGKKLIDYSLNMLADADVRNAVVNVSYKAEMIAAHVANRQTPGITLSYEDGTPLETGGGIAKALPSLGVAPFYSMNSDAITIGGAKALQRLADNWQSDLLALLLVVPVENAHGYEGKGDFFVEKDGRFRRRTDNETAPYIFTGVQILHPALFADSPAGAFSLNLLYNRHVGEGGWFHRMRALVHEDAWLHVGNVAGLKEAEKFL